MLCTWEYCTFLFYFVRKTASSLTCSCRYRSRLEAERVPQPSRRSEHRVLVLRQRPQGNPNRCCASTRIVPRPTAGKPCRSHHCAQRLARALLRHGPKTPASRRLRLAKQRARQQTASSRTSRPRHSDEWESALIAEGRIIITDVFDLISHDAASSFSLLPLACHGGVRRYSPGQIPGNGNQGRYYPVIPAVLPGLW